MTKFLKSSQIESMQKIQEKTEQMRKNALTLISEKKKEIHDNMIEIVEFIDRVHNKDLLMEILNIKLSIPEIKNRPRLEIITNDIAKIKNTKKKIIDNIKSFYSDIPVYDFNQLSHPTSFNYITYHQQLINQNVRKRKRRKRIRKRRC